MPDCSGSQAKICRCNPKNLVIKPRLNGRLTAMAIPLRSIRVSAIRQKDTKPLSHGSHRHSHPFRSNSKGCEFSRLNIPKKSTDADFHSRISQKSQRDADFHSRISQKSQRMRTFTAEYSKKVNGCGLSRLNTPKRWADADFHSRISQKSQRMRTFTAEYPQKVNGCGLSRLNIPKKSTDADFHKRIKTVVPNIGNT